MGIMEKCEQENVNKKNKKKIFNNSDCDDSDEINKNISDIISLDIIHGNINKKLIDDQVFHVLPVLPLKIMTTTFDTECTDNMEEPLIITSANNDNNNNNDNDLLVKCIFLCEFHATAGPKIVVQVPDSYITKELFDTVNRYIIPKAQLQKSFLSVSLLGKKILGYPVRIDNKQYQRNSYHFNICFVFAPTTRTIGYEPVCRKLTEYLLSMELSTRILSEQKNKNQLERLIRLLSQVRDDINNKGMCMLQEGSSIIPLSVVPYYRETITIHPHQAPVLMDEFHKYVRAQWDLTTLRILPYVDGFSHINRIAAMADVALGLVKDCIKHLVLLGVAIIVPVFQYSNVYRPTPKLSQLAKCKMLQKRCVDRCAKSIRQKPFVRDVFRIFASMAHGATFGELCVRFNPAILNINEKQMVLFGLMEGLIRIVNKYPVTVKRNLFTGNDDDDTIIECQETSLDTILLPPGSVPVLTSSPITANMNNYQKFSSLPLPRRGGNIRTNNHQQNPQTYNQQYLSQNFYNIYLTHHYTGLKSFDEICCATGLSCQQLEAHLSRDKHVIVLLK